MRDGVPADGQVKEIFLLLRVHQIDAYAFEGEHQSVTRMYQFVFLFKIENVEV